MPGSLTRVTGPTAESSQMAFWLSDVERMGEADDEWGFTVYGDKDVFLATGKVLTRLALLDLECASVLNRGLPRASRDYIGELSVK